MSKQKIDVSQGDSYDKIYKLYILIMLLVLVSCKGNKTFDNIMHRADSIMDVNDDSAKVAIQMLNDIKGHTSEFSTSQEMRFQLLYHKAMNKAYISFYSDSIMLEVADYYEHNGSANDRLLAYYVLGCVYRDMNEAPLALEYFNKATEQADTTSKNCDYSTLYRIYSQMGILFDKQYLPYQELNAFEQAEKYAYLAKDTFNAIVNLQYKAGGYDYLNMTDSVIAINLQASRLFKQHGYEEAAAIAFGCNYSYYLNRGEFEKAKDSFEAYLNTGFEGNPNYQDSKAFVLYERGNYYLNTSQLDSAYKYLKNSWELCESYGNKCVTAKALAEYYLKTNNNMLASKYALLSSQYNDSNIIETRYSQLQQMQSLYDYSRNQNKAIKAEQIAEHRNHIIYCVTLGSFALLTCLTVIYRRQIMLKKKRLSATRSLYEDSLLKLKRLQDELAHIVAENNNEQSLHIREKEEAIGRLRKEIEDIREKYSNPLMSDTDVILRNSSIYKKIRYIEMHPRECLQEDDWCELAATIESLIPSFVPILKERISQKEYQICLLVRMGISSSTIANLVGLSAPGVSAARKRMLWKLCNKDGNPKEFDKFVNQIT